MRDRRDNCYHIPSWGIALNVKVARNISSQGHEHQMGNYHPWGPHVARVSHFTGRINRVINAHFVTASRFLGRLRLIIGNKGGQ